MRLPLSWLRDFIEGDLDVDAVSAALTSRGFAVDAIVEQPTPALIVVGRIATLARHPNADKLQVSSVDIGTETLQIVTGATNVATGDMVPIALVGSTVFTGAASADGVRETKSIARAKLRGVESVGMMCSAIELALPGEFPDGILILDADARAGDDFWSAVRHPRATLDVDVPSNRADCLSVIGLAREAAAGLGRVFREPSWPENAGEFASPIAVAIEDRGVCRRLIGQYFRGARNRRTPLWMTLRLHAAGMRGIDFLVDVSNYVQIETGQPLHFYDAAKIAGGRIVARSARAGERLVTLDGVERALDEGTPVIADGEGPVGVAGIFGGERAGVSAETIDVFLESPNFVGPRIRRAAVALGLRTEGAMRHERGLPLELAEIGRRAAAALLLGAGAQGSAVTAVGEEPGPSRLVDMRVERASALLGSRLEPDDVVDALAPIGFTPARGEPMRVTIPWWRPDVALEVDLIEEVARSRGFDRIEERRDSARPQTVDESAYRQERRLAQVAAALDYREIVSIALQGSRAIGAWERSGLAYWTSCVGVVNPLSDDQRFLRPSLLPGLLAAAERSRSAAAGGGVRLFEIGHVFRDGGAEKTGGALEWPSLAALACFDSADESGSVDRRLLAVKGDAERLIAACTSARLDTFPKSRSYFHPGASADLVAGGKTVAKFGRIHPRLADAYELPATSYALLLYLERLPMLRPPVAFAALPRFPGTRRDIAVVVDESVYAGDLLRAIRSTNAPLFEDARAFDEYAGAQVPAGKKSIALAVMLRRTDATITDAQADASMKLIVDTLHAEFAATLRGPAQG